MTPSRPEEKGSTPAMETEREGAMRLPERRRRRVVLPAPLLPIRSVREPEGRRRLMSVRPVVPSGNA